MATGYKRTLDTPDLFKVNDDNRVETLTRKFEDIFMRRLQRAQDAHIAAKRKKRHEGPGISSVPPEVDLQDFVPPKFLCL